MKMWPEGCLINDVMLLKLHDFIVISFLLLSSLVCVLCQAVSMSC